MSDGPRLTIFTAPRGFEGQYRRIQMNAIRSWVALQPTPEVLVFGREAGTEEACTELGVRWIPDVELTAAGLPVMSDMFAHADRAASYDCLAYVNIDIVLMQDVVDALAALGPRASYSVAVGAPWNVPVPYDLDTAADGWQRDLRETTKRSGKPPTLYGADIFVYPRGSFSDAPPFSIGRVGFDKWLMARARFGPLPGVDITDAAVLVHQDHSGSTHSALSDRVSVGPDADTMTNLSLTTWWMRMTYRRDIPLYVTSSGEVRKRPLRGRSAFAVRVVLRQIFAWIMGGTERSGLPFFRWWRRLRAPGPRDEGRR